jgi:hypothetical protein
MVLKVFLVT